MKNNILHNQKIAIGLDIGTTKVCAIVLSETENVAQYKIMGFSSVQSTGMRRGVITNIQKTTDAITKVISEVQQKTGVSVSDIMVGIAGDHIEAMSSVSTVIVSNANRIITEDDVERAIDDLRQSKISSDRKIIHIVPYEYVIDEQDGITQPIGMCGTRLQANVHVVTGLKTAIQNIHLCIENIPGLKINDIILEPIASSLALLNEDEKEVGVCLIDIGGGTTDITIFKDDVLRFTSEVALGGNNITEDIKKYFCITKIEAERIKCDYGHTYKPAILKKDEQIMIKSVGGAATPREISKEVLCDIIQVRMEELLKMCYEEVRKSGLLYDLGAGIVLTGGTSQLNGLVDLATQVFRVPVHIGYPSGDKYIGLSTEIESPIYSTAVGLALHSLSNANKNKIYEAKEKPAVPIQNDTTNENTQEEETEDTEQSTSLMKKISTFFTKL